MITYKIHLIRHGQTNEAFLGVFLGRMDVPLSPDGRQNLMNKAEEFYYPPVPVVFTSPLARCTETAEILYPGHDIEEMPAFVECDFGDFTGLSAEELAANPDYAEWIQGGFNAQCPGGESGMQVLTRAAEGIQEIFARMMREKITDVAVVTHGGIIMSLLAACGLPKRQMQEWVTDYGCGFTLLFTPALWMRDGSFEIHAELPYRGMDEKFSDDFGILDGFSYQNDDDEDFV